MPLHCIWIMLMQFIKLYSCDDVQPVHLKHSGCHKMSPTDKKLAMAQLKAFSQMVKKLN